MQADVRVTGFEFGEPASTKDLRKEAMAYAAGHLIGQSFVNINSGHSIKVTRQGMKHSLSKTNGTEVKIVAGLGELLTKAQYIGSVPDRLERPHILAAHKYAAVVQVGAELLNVGLVTHQKFDGYEHYDHFIVTHK